MVDDPGDCTHSWSLRLLTLVDDPGECTHSWLLWLLTLVDDVLEELSLTFLLASVHVEVVEGRFGTVAHLVMLAGHLVLGCGEVRLLVAALVDAQPPVRARLTLPLLQS